jgi:hypothetical protein
VDRPELPPRDRSLVTVSALIAMNRPTSCGLTSQERATTASRRGGDRDHHPLGVLTRAGPARSPPSADPEAYELPRNVGIKLNHKDVSRAKELLGYPWFQKKPRKLKEKDCLD